MREYVIDAGMALENLAVLETDIGLHGHTHVPVAFSLVPDGAPARSSSRRAVTAWASTAGPSLVNPGSVGQPRDGDPEASYLVLDLDTATVTWHRVAYDIAAVQAAIRAAGLPGRLADRLAFGA